MEEKELNQAESKAKPLLTNRQETVLFLLVEEYIRNAQPVGSNSIAGEMGDVSSATIRNECAELEALGYLEKPHTSAGRVPTQQAYRTYVKHLQMQAIEPDTNLVEAFRNLAKDRPDYEVGIRTMGKLLAQYVHTASCVCLTPTSVYYTGFTYLFEEPEFAHKELVRDIGEMIDSFDSVFMQSFPHIARGAHILIGSQNPFGQNLGAAVIRCAPYPERENIFAFVGPLRMRYDRALQAMRTLEFISTSSL